MAWAACTPLRPFCFAPLFAAEAEDAEEIIAMAVGKRADGAAATSFHVGFCKNSARNPLVGPSRALQHRLDHIAYGVKLPKRQRV
ncbi:MAG: hypothetical protein K9M98_16065 [Cephaloticoccus sp.]|nr:hypothetical protein [Cephaloticoccus sp.]MCF7762018.1 hypothetical protein [Cephaloticoccus sp.]